MEKSCLTAARNGCTGIRTFRNFISEERAENGAATAISSSIAGGGDGMAELEIDRLTLRFGGLTVLDDISLTVEKAQLFALIGPNGAVRRRCSNWVGGV